MGGSKHLIKGGKNVADFDEELNGMPYYDLWKRF